MERYIIWNLNSLPEFESIPPDEFQQILADYRSDTFKHWHTWLEIAIKMLFGIFGHFLYYFLKPAGTSSALWWLITVLLFGILGAFIVDQVRAHATRNRLREFIWIRNSKKDLELTESDVKLYEDLRHLRVNIAVAKGIPSNTICNDRVLQEMARSRPINLGGLIRIPGVTAEFIKIYGKTFVDEISMHIEGY